MPEPNQENERLNLVCHRFGTDVPTGDFENEDEAREAGWRKDSQDHWYSPEAMEDGGICTFCGEYINRDDDEYLCDVDGDGEIYHCECARDHGCFWCCRCEDDHWTDNVDEVLVYVHRDGYTDEEYWCRDCADADAEWNDEDESYHYYMSSRREENYSNIHPHPEGWKDEICQGCYDNGYSGRGGCEKCLRAQADNKELQETTLWIYDTSAATQGFYHPRQHIDFKKMFYRDKHEHPHLYYGVEVEVSFEIRNMEPRIVDVAAEFIRLTGGLFVAESDSSLQNGIEFISRPTSYKMWTNPETIKRLRAGFEYLKSKGAYINQPKSNGIHIHMSRKFFERNTTKSVDQINRDLDWIFQYFQPEVEKISQREYTRFCYSKMNSMKNSLANSPIVRHKGFEDMKIVGTMSPSQIVDGSLEHHAVIAMRNETIEVRCFKSSVDVDTIISYIEFVRNIAHTVRNKDIKDMTLKDILASKDSPALDQYVWKLERKGFNADKKVKPKMKYEINQKELLDVLRTPF